MYELKNKNLKHVDQDVKRLYVLKHITKNIFRNEFVKNIEN